MGRWGQVAGARPSQKFGCVGRSQCIVTKVMFTLNADFSSSNSAMAGLYLTGSRWFDPCKKWLHDPLVQILQYFFSH